MMKSQNCKLLFNPSSFNEYLLLVCSKLISKVEHRRCSLCDSLLKSSSTHRYFSTGKSIHERMKVNNHPSITYAKCCEKYLRAIKQVDQLTMICLKCSEHLQRIHSWHVDAQILSKQMCRTFSKTKRLKRLRTPSLENLTILDIKQEQQSTIESVALQTISPIEQQTNQCDLGRKNTALIPVQSSTNNSSFDDSANGSPVRRLIFVTFIFSYPFSLCY